MIDPQRQAGSPPCSCYESGTARTAQTNQRAFSLRACCDLPGEPRGQQVHQAVWQDGQRAGYGPGSESTCSGRRSAVATDVGQGYAPGSSIIIYLDFSCGPVQRMPCRAAKELASCQILICCRQWSRLPRMESEEPMMLCFSICPQGWVSSSESGSYWKTLANSWIPRWSLRRAQSILHRRSRLWLSKYLCRGALGRERPVVVDQVLQQQKIRDGTSFVIKLGDKNAAWQCGCGDQTSPKISCKSGFEERIH